MGLFGSIFSGLTGGIFGDALQASSSAKAVKKAAAAQAAAIQAATAEQQREYDTTRSDYAPYRDAGTSAIGSLLDLLGLGENGADGQAAAIGGIKSSPLFTSQYDTGLDAILQSAAATGGLRGGNTENSLAQFGSGLLSNLIGSQIGNFTNLANLGMGAVGGTTNAGLQTSNNISNLALQNGQVQSGSILGQQGIYNNLSNNIQSKIQSLIGGGMKF